MGMAIRSRPLRLGVNHAEHTRTAAVVERPTAYESADLSRLRRSDATNQHRAAWPLPKHWRSEFRLRVRQQRQRSSRPSWL